MYSLVVLVLYRPDRFEDVLAAWHDAGAPGVTVFDCVGTRGKEEQGKRGDFPLLPTIRDLLGSDDAPRKTVFSIVPDEVVDALVRATEETVGDLEASGNGLLFALPVPRVHGIRRQHGGA